MIKRPRGTSDIYGRRMEILSYVTEVFHEVLEKANYHEIVTPTFEAKELFVRSVGETSDVVSKEMYDFQDKKGRDLVLRPEGTAGVVRALIENKLYVLNNLPLKLFYQESMYRYERPQAGRQRQFNQLGIETFGADDVKQDLEIIVVAMDILKALQLDTRANIHINYLVNGEERVKYTEALRTYLKSFNDLCSDCQIRIEKNPLRALDCKIDGAKFTDAPVMSDYLKPEDQTRFDDLVELLKQMGYQTTIDANLVRGLDYYTGCVFEIKYDSQINKDQLTLIGGGRYNNLVQELGGPSTPAAGFGLGIERLLDILENEEINLPINGDLDIYVIVLTFNDQVMKAINNLRQEANLKVDFNLMNNTMKSGFKEAEKYRAKEVMILGEKELQTNKAKLKNQTSGEEVEVDLNDWLSIAKIVGENK
ncbi:histidine--tRNA ligase [Mesoplasma lactucae]|uniref:Histidine--tRNA ligase n=1 Tax=Mesoplasma lactucae ATCC 49193 TaxID=81460 RepID=A0A291IRG0_9MOLU|nr:histidine--tRNA ligase [Mesoplasma lactucae]ATG97363.1 histidine--tRNA ligase [Mesoplasma lactucae ATCC 49193]ATZ20185.1 histidyl-tRNA synthetase [Mesoplasma lactucae ATCC 49193]MCL8216934.1 Histidine--tRNA ligase [Mesoplasma lactucae ATCC 49193]